MSYANVVPFTQNSDNGFERFVRGVLIQYSNKVVDISLPDYLYVIMEGEAEHPPYFFKPHIPDKLYGLFGEDIENVLAQTGFIGHNDTVLSKVGAALSIATHKFYFEHFEEEYEE